MSSNKTPHRPPPLERKAPMAPLPPLPTPPNLDSGYNPSTSSSPALTSTTRLDTPPWSPLNSLLLSPTGGSATGPRVAGLTPPQSPQRTEHLAPPRPRVSRSASPLGKIRKSALPHTESVEGPTDAEAVSKTVREDMARLTRRRSSTKAAPSVRPPTPPPPPSPPSRSPNRSPRVSASATATQLARTATLVRQGNLLSRTFSRSGGRNKNTPPPPINVPAPPVPEVPVYWRDSVVSTQTADTRRTNGTDSTRASQMSNISHLSSISSRSSGSSYRSSMDSESAAVERTLKATASIKSSKSATEKKRSRFLTKRKVDPVVSKPLISPPTMVHTSSTSPLMKLRNRTSMGASGGVEQEEKGGLIEVDGKRRRSTQVASVGLVAGNVEQASLKKSASMVELESEPQVSKVPERPTLNKSDRAMSTASTDTATSMSKGKPKKTKTFGVPWSKQDRRAPEAHDDLIAGGFFTRSQLPPVKYTRLPVLAINGSDLEKAGTDGAGVRVSMQLQPMVWYDETKRKTIRMSRMSLRMAQTTVEERSDGRKSQRTSWIPASRFSWLPGQEDQLSHLASPPTSARSHPKSPLKSPLAIVGEEAEPNEASDEAVDTRAVRRATAAKLEGTTGDAKDLSLSEDGIEASCLSQSGSRDVKNAEERHMSSVPVDHQGSQSQNKPDSEIADDVTIDPKEDQASHTIRWSEGSTEDTRALRHVLQQNTEETPQVPQSVEPEDASDTDTGTDPILQLPSVRSKRISQSLQQLVASLAQHSDKTEESAGNIEGFSHSTSFPAQANNRLSWMLNTGAPPPHDVRILAAVPAEDGDPTSNISGDDNQCAMNANVELRILSAYNLPDEAQVLAVIAEENEDDMSNERDDRGENGPLQVPTDANTFSMMVSSPGLPPLRMIGMADIEEDPSSDEETFDQKRTGSGEFSASQSEYSDDESIDEEGASSNRLSSDEANNEASVELKDVADVAQATDKASSVYLGEAKKREYEVVQPLQLSCRSKGEESHLTVGNAPYLPGPIRFSRPEGQRNSIAGMDIWNDQDMAESAWQRSEKGLIDGILDFFNDTVSTSETWCGAEETLVDDEGVDFSFMKAPLLDGAFVGMHAVEDIFAIIIDPSKPPPLPPLPTDFVLNRPLSPPRWEFARSTDSLRSVGSGASVGQRGTQRKPKPVPVSTPKIGTFLMKGGLF